MGQHEHPSSREKGLRVLARIIARQHLANRIHSPHLSDYLIWLLKPWLGITSFMENSLSPYVIENPAVCLVLFGFMPPYFDW